MGLWSATSNLLSGGARDDASEGYDKANNYIQPYRKGGVEDYNSLRTHTANMGSNIAPYNTSGNFQHNQINQSPNAYYEQIMKGYAESPQAKFEQEQAMRAANAGGAASGMLGSGAYQKAIQQNAADIGARDQQRYYGNVMGANAMQMDYLRDLRGRQDQHTQMMQYLTNLGYGASGQMGQNAISKGLSNAQYDQSAFDQIMGGVGAMGQSYMNQGASQMPAYASNAIMAG